MASSEDKSWHTSFRNSSLQNHTNQCLINNFALFLILTVFNFQSFDFFHFFVFLMQIFIPHFANFQKLSIISRNTIEIPWTLKSVHILSKNFPKFQKKWNFTKIFKKKTPKQPTNLYVLLCKTLFQWVSFLEYRIWFRRVHEAWWPLHNRYICGNWRHEWLDSWLC